MIPKIIHYCWFGRGKMPYKAVECIDSWKKYLKDYEIICWSEDNFNLECNQYVMEAYQCKKYAFVSDYVRLFALYNYGGVYLDTDVEVLKPLDKFLFNRAFTGCENENMCVTGTMAAEKGHKWISDLLDNYDNRKFILSDGNYDKTPNTHVITSIMQNNYGWVPSNDHQILREDINVYPFEVFCAKDHRTGRVKVTNETHTIHHFAGSWISKTDKRKAKIRSIIGARNTKVLMKIKRRIKSFLLKK